MDKSRVLVCSAWPYASGVPHLGNLVGCLLSGDAFARYYRMRGKDVLYVSGSDVHGTRVEYEAEQEGISAAALAERIHQRIVEINRGFGIEFDNYTTTETKTHKEFVRGIYLQMESNGYICNQEESRAYCLHCERFLADRLITGTCPRCGSADALGNQCDTCGAMLEPEELVDPVCSFCGRSEIEFRKTRHWYLDLERLSEPLRDYVASKSFQGNVLLYTKRMLEEGLRPRAMTRDIDWGIAAPFEGAEGKVIYVWGEAALGYVSAVIEHFEGAEPWKDYWFGDDVHQVYTLAKDNIAFHTLIFPGQLIASGSGYHLPDQIAATEYLNWIGGDSFSKHRGVGLYCDEALEVMDGELWRFYLLYNRPEGRDVNFSWEELEKAVNGVLISNVANLMNRVISFVQAQFDGIVPKTELDAEVVDRLAAGTKAYEDAFTRGTVGEALRAVCDLAVFGNEYFQRKRPWETKDEVAVASGIHLVKGMAIALFPYVPSFASAILSVLGLSEARWDDIPKPMGGERLSEKRVLLDRIDIDEIRDRVKQGESGMKVEDRKPSISFADFEKLDLRVGAIEAAAEVLGADKLLHLSVDFGGVKRSCVAGIKGSYSPDQLIGKSVVALVNLEPRMIRGVQSECMLLAAGGEELTLAVVDRPVEPGTSVS
ncbi:MAG: methionine--tRNA ligase [Candidatus Bipolaricaulia bacterium]